MKKTVMYLFALVTSMQTLDTFAQTAISINKKIVKH